MKLTGIIESGTGEAAFFTQLDWVVEQFEKVLGSKPFPGTLNVRISDVDLLKLNGFFSEKDCELIPDNEKFCSASLKKVWINGIAGAAVFPGENVRIHEKSVIEIMSGYYLKGTLHLADGDEITITDCESYPGIL